MRRAATAARALTRQTFTAARQVSAPHLAACTTASVRRSFSEGPPAPADEARLSETFLSGTAAQYLEELYLDWTEDPSSVHPSWNAYFKGLAAGAPPGAAHCKPGDAPVPTGGGGSEILSLQQLVRAYQHTGHSDADLDPLGVRQADITLHDASGTQLESLNPATYGWSDADLTKSFNLGSSVSSGYLAAGELTLGEVMQKLKHTYTSKIGFEFMHLQSRSVVNWFRDRVERYPMYEMDVEKKKLILERLMDATLFEEFLATKYANDKRFGLEGCEALIPGMKALIDSSADYGVEAVVIGMPHRGRLNVLTQVMEKPMEALFSEFAGSNATDEGSGDVKYHLGTSIDRKTRNGKTVHMSLAANPSHLEAVNPVIAGKARAIAREKAKEATGSNFATQTAVCEHGLKAVMPICLHGDAAFAGQGVVYETMGMCELPCYANGGTVHVIVNNQIGFTTDPRFSRSTPYCCDLGKTYNAPIFHVNGDDPEAVVFVAELAAEWRATFQKDVIIDIVCYRRNGHNEQDQPSFTSPGMYEVISKHATGLDIYSDRLISEGVVTPEYVDQEKERINGVFEEAFVRSTSEGYQDESMWMESRWTKFKNAYEPGMPTGCDEETLKEVGIATTVMPEGFTLHKSLERIMKVRRKTVEQGAEMDFATAEAMAFGTLLKEGYHVRLSGQDVQRGTFSHRHALVHDQNAEDKNEGRTHVPLNFLSDDQPELTISNSHLSEYAVLGFELGYDMHSPKHLVLWEAQFGDFANTAQCIIDQFVSSGETKWMRQSGLVMLLPHGYEGMGPEHSSARMERFLQMTEEDPDVFPEDMSNQNLKQHERINWAVTNCSTAANYYHLLRRQVKRGFRKPLIAMQPKSLLRLKEAGANMEDINEGTHFKPVLPESSPESLVAPEEVKRVVFCCGKVYYDLARARALNEIDDIAIARVEELAPFPFDKVRDVADSYPNAEIIWCQEEPLNQGPWYHVEPRIVTSLNNSEHHKGKWDLGAGAFYAGRSASASTSTGFKYTHITELHNLLADALKPGAEIERVDGGFPVWAK